MIQIDDGELIDCVLDHYTVIEPPNAVAPMVQRTTELPSVSANSEDAPQWRWAAAFVGILALGVLALVAVMMPLHMIAIGAMAFFFLALWMASPVLLALMSPMGGRLAPVVTRLGVVRRGHSGAVVAARGSGRTQESPRTLRRSIAHPPTRRASTHKSSFKRRKAPSHE